MSEPPDNVPFPPGVHSATNEWLAMLDRDTEARLRSPAFLRLLKQQIDLLIQTRRVSQQQLPSAVGTRSPAEFHDDLSRLEQRLDAVAERRRQRRESSSADARADSTSARGCTPWEVAGRRSGIRVLRYHNPNIRYAEPVLVCFALVNRPWVLDLQPERSVICRLLERGFDVFLIDWGVPAESDCSLTLSDYVCERLRQAVELTCEVAGSDRLSLLGYCMGGTLATMFTALYPQRVSNLLLLATPIDFGGEAGLLNLWTQPEVLDVDGLIDAWGNCPGELLQVVFQLMRPVQNVLQKAVTVSERLADRAFLENFLALERWAGDSIPVAGETFREFVKWMYQENRLVQDRVCLVGRDVRLDAITCPVLLLVAEQDHLVPPASTLALIPLVSTKDIRSLSIDAGHVGLAVSSRAHQQLWPVAAEWLAARSAECT